MPKKSIKDYKTKRRDIWKTKSAKRNGEDKKIGNNVYIGAGNAKRWVILKKKLDYMSDKDFVTYLLDLADPNGGLSELSPTADEADKDDGPAFSDKVANRTEAIDSSSRSPSDVDDREWHPQGLDDRLRRSPRKQSKSHVRRSGRKSQSEKKTKTHKKKKRKKVDKVEPDEEVEENTVVSDHEQNDVVDAVEEGPPTLEAEPIDRADDASAVEETEMPTLEPGQAECKLEEVQPLEREPGEIRTVLVMKGDVHIEVGERVKLKRREKHRRSSSQDPPDKHKHKKKKHRHGDHGAKRKHHDVRKAPHDGVPRSPAPVEEAVPPPPPPPPPPAPPSPAPVRAIFKTKLCANCNRRHAPTACPLLTPARIVVDGVPFDEWEANRKATARPEEEEEEDDNSNNLDIEDMEREPTFALASLPKGLTLQVIDPTHGFSVLTSQSLPPYTQLGPLIGQSIKEMDIPDDFNMKDIWEATPIDSKERVYLSTVDPNQSNWLRYLRPAPSRDQRNIAPVVRGDVLMFYTMVEVANGNELLYWADHTPTWSKKKMEKTNCGGCNLRFSHPLYYRLHCAVFHDPNFSLTIRKYHCKVCGAAVLGKENIMRHASEQHDGKGAYRCQFCNKFFLRLNYLEMHRTYGCAANPQRTRPLCDFCGRKFCQPQKLKVHIKRMHSDMAEVLREFQCKICLKLLGSRAALQRHMKEVHHKDIVGACTCDRCGKMFQNKSNLKIHMLTHSGVKPFKCRQTQCNAAFTTKQCLQFHYKKVHSFSEHSMPTIERSVAYTFDAYSGNKGGEKGRGRGRGRGKSSSYDDENENEDSLLTMMDGDSSSSNMTAADVSSSNPETCNNAVDEQPPNLSPPDNPLPPKSPTPQPPTLDSYPTYIKPCTTPQPQSPPRYKTPPYEVFCEKPRSPPPEPEYAYGKPPSRGASPLLEAYPRCHHPMEGQELDAYSYGKPKSPEPVYGNSYGKPKSPEPVYGNSYGKPKSPEPVYGNSYGKPKSPEPVYGNSYGKPKSPEPVYGNSYGKPKSPEPVYGNSYGKPKSPEPIYGNSYGKPKSPEQVYGNSYGKPKSPEQVYGNSYGKPKSPEQVYGNSYGKPKSPDEVYGNSYGKPKSPETVYVNSYGKPKSPETVYGNSYVQSQGPSRGPSPHEMEGYGYGKGSPEREEYNQNNYKKTDGELEPYYGKVLSKGSKKWMGDHSVSLSPRSPPIDEVIISVGKPPQRDLYEDKREVYEFAEEKCTIEIVKMVECEEDKRDKLRVKPLSSFRRPDSSTASLLVEAALDAAQRDIIDSTPSVIMTQLESPMDYMPDELRHRLSPGALAHMEGAGYRLAQAPPEHYLRQEPAPHLGDAGGTYIMHYDDEPASPSVTPRSHVEYAQQDLGSPASGAPSLRYDLRQVEGLSSDEESLVAQNLTKEKALQLYDVEDQGLDMSRSAPYHPFNAPLPPRYHLYDDRYSPPAYPDVVRVVSLDLTPGRHTVDLSLPRSSHHHPHHHLHQSRLLSSPPLAPPMPNQNLMSPPPPHNSYPTYLPPSPRSAQPQGYHHYSGYY